MSPKYYCWFLNFRSGHYAQIWEDADEDHLTMLNVSLIKWGSIVIYKLIGLENRSECDDAKKSEVPLQLGGKMREIKWKDPLFAPQPGKVIKDKQNKIDFNTWNPYSRGRLSTVDLLVLTCLYLHLKLQTWFTFYKNEQP